MSEESQGQEKKETRVEITVKSWDASGKKFLLPQEDVDARRLEVKGNVWFFVPVKQAIGRGQPRVGSEIVDADKSVWVVTQAGSTGQGEYRAEVKKKEPEKQP